MTRVNDSAGKSARFQYNAAGARWKITDSADLVSELTYGANNFITGLATPYGLTQFATGFSTPNRWLQITDPFGGKERYEYREWCGGIADAEPTAPPGFTNSGLRNRNSFHWSKKAMAEMTNGSGVVVLDYAKARVTRWLKTADGARTAAVPHSTKEPLEGRVWYQYASQPGPNQVGSQGQPIQTARVLDGGATESTLATYNTFGKVTERTDPVGRRFAFDYATDGIDLTYVRQIRNGANQTIKGWWYYSKHQPQYITNAAGKGTTIAYNTRAQVDMITNARNAKTKYVYYPDAPGQPRHGRVQSITEAFGTPLAATTTLDYDGFGRLASVQQPDGYATKTLDRPTRTTYPSAPGVPDYEEITWNRLDPEWTRDRRGLLTHRVHDALRRVSQVTDPLNRVTKFEWCTCGSLEALRDPLNRRTSWTRDTMARVTAKKLGEVSAEQTIATYTYEPRSGRLATMTDALAQVATYGYTADGRVASITYTGEQQTTPDVTVAYDPDYPRLASVTATGLPALTYGYVPINSSDTVYGDGNVASITGYFGDVTTYTYDELDRRLTRTLEGVSTSTYDALGRVSGWSNPLGSFTPAYLAAANGAPTPRLDYMNYPNGMQVDFDWYDNPGGRRLKEIYNKASGGVTITKHGYTYDADGGIKDWTQQMGANPASRWELGPDNADQLVWLDVKDAVSGALQKSYDYIYDLAGNRTTEQIDATATPTTWTPNALNQLTTQSNPARTFAYDLNGAMTSNGGGQTYLWDGAGRLKKITYTSTGQTSEFVYDGLGRRVKIIERSNTGTITSEKRYVWEGMEIVQERNGYNSLQRRFYPEGEILDNGYYGYPGYTPSKGFYSRDHLGSVREFAVTGQSPTSYSFDPWGRRSVAYSYYSTDFGYTGHYHHGPSGLTLAPFRAYDAELGRWLSRDPIGERGGINLYAYVGNNPITATDPLGLWTGQIGFSGSIGFIFGVQGSASLVFDGHGNVNVAISGGFRGGWFVGGGAGVVVGGTTADCINDLKGTSAGGFLDAGPLGGLSGEMGLAPWPNHPEYAPNVKPSYLGGSYTTPGPGLSIGAGVFIEETGFLF